MKRNGEIMRASRVIATTSSTFRDYRPVNQVNDTSYQPGEEYSHNQHHKREQFQKELAASKGQGQPEEQGHNLTLEDLEGEVPIHIEKELDDKLKNLDELNKKKKLIQKYKSSI